MTAQSVHTAAPYLLLAELGFALVGGSAASAEERITLEVIGAVRMAGPDELRRADGASHQADAQPTREAATDGASDGMSAHRN